MQSFHELGVSARVAQALAERDIHTPFRIQTLVLPDALAGRDVLAKSPTGSG
ncbi:MAG: DEAD/DEAH box helicase [Actinobacteria bacterium]|nr:DEAD/DEAH box helicase [Actinomycetota bacterium]